MARIQYHTDEAALQVLASRLGEPVTLAYGRHMVGGTPVFQDEQTDGSTVLFIALGEGEWDAIEYLWVNGKLVDVTDTTKVHFHPGIDGEVGTESTPGTRNQKICSFFPAGFTQTTFSRTCYSALHLAADPTAPSAEFDIRGIFKTRRVRIFDAAGNQTDYKYSANPAWEFLDAYISQYLMPRALAAAALTEAAKARINFPVFVQSAVDCDYDIGGGVKRFESHVAFMQKTNLATIFETLMSLCRGYVLEEGGKLGLYVDKPRASIFTITSDVIRYASFEIPAKDLREVCNQVTVKIRDIESGGADHSRDFAPFTAIHNEQWHQDMVGRVIPQDMDLGANTKERSERLALYWMKRSLLPEQAELKVTMDAGHLLPGDVITAPQDHNFSATRDWEVMEASDEPLADQDGRLPASAFLRELVLQEYDPTIFSDTAGGQQETEESGVSTVPGVLPSCGGYAPTANPLTAMATTGTAGVIKVAPFVMKAPGGGREISCLSSTYTIGGLTQGIHYYVYYDDPNFLGGNVTPHATEVFAVLTAVYGRFTVGEITVPYLEGGTQVKRPTTYTDSGTFSTDSPELAYDTSEDTAAIVAGGYDPGEEVGVYGQCIWKGIEQPATVTAATLKVKSEYTQIGSVLAVLSYSINAGLSWDTIFSQSSDRALTTDSISLSPSQDFTKVWVKGRVDSHSGPGAHWGILRDCDGRIEYTA
jgi:hypothetical protein